MALELPLHGGDLASAQSRWGRPAEGWLDLSTGINPWPYPIPDIPPEAWHRLPGREAEEALRRAAARRFAAHPDKVLAAPGTSSLIRALPRCRKPGIAAILSPTYGEHEAAWSETHQVRRIAGLDQVGDADVVVVVNPNNPDGATHAPGTLVELARQGKFVVVDEAFADAAPARSAIPYLEPGMVVLRSFGKFYGLAGLRLGFAVSHDLAALAAQLGPWPVSGPALAVGAAALSDDAWYRDSVDRLAGWSARLDAVLDRAGLSLVGGTTLFRLARHEHAPELYERLGRAGILVRAFAARPDWLRFGLPPDEAGLERLAAAL